MGKDSFWKHRAQFYSSDSKKSAADTLKGITHLVVLAHPDDAEIVAPDIIDLCRKDKTKKMGVIIVTDGQGAPRYGNYEKLSNRQLAAERTNEQVHAAMSGKYEFLAMLKHPDLAAKPIDRESAMKEIHALMRQCPKLQAVVTHNPFDKHPGHLGVMSATIGALKMLSPDAQHRIKDVRGAEVWGEIGWVGEPWIKKIPLDADDTKLQVSLLGAHHSQTIGAMDYVPGVVGRQKSRAVFENPFGRQEGLEGIMLAVDLLPLIREDGLYLEEYSGRMIKEYSKRMIENAIKYEPRPSGEIAPGATLEQAVRRLPRIARGA